MLRTVVHPSAGLHNKGNLAQQILEMEAMLCQTILAFVTPEGCFSRLNPVKSPAEFQLNY